MQRTIRLFLCQCLVAGLALPLSAAAAQETRGKISGTVRDTGGVIPGASVRITNSDTMSARTSRRMSPAISRRQSSIPAATP